MRVTTRDIRPTTAHASCDVCGRTLLRGEHSHVYLDGGERRSVCELCTTRALDEGWVKEGAMPAFDARSSRADRRRSLLRRFRHRDRDQPLGEADERPGEARDGEDPAAGGGATPRAWNRTRRAGQRLAEQIREPRHVHAIPAGLEQRMAAAIEVFNGSEHRRTVAGVARSLGPPIVSVLAQDEPAGVVHVVAAWELCWYRYEIDLSDEVPAVRLEGQGYELEELSEREREANATSDEHGSLALVG